VNPDWLRYCEELLLISYVGSSVAAHFGAHRRFFFMLTLISTWLNTRLIELREDPNRLGPKYEEIKVCDRIVELNRREETMWRQRSRIQRLALGDSNLKFFQQQASHRRNKNHISELTFCLTGR
jgi:hypothetical protein